MNSRVIVAISGGGRSLLNLLEQQDQHSYEIVGVLSSSADCKGNGIAKDGGLPLLVADFSEDTVADKVAAFITKHEGDWVALAGFLKKFPIKSKWRDRIINIHPALLPAHGGKGMYGLRVHEAVVKSGDEVSGATIHFVNEVYDDGAVIAQAKVPATGVQSAEELADRVFKAECQLFPAVLHGLVEGTLPLASGVKVYEF